MEKIVIVSGYFNPVHSGHINLFKEAKKIGDKLIVILNNDNQVRIKSSFPFMGQEERKKVVESLKYVDDTVISVDEDGTVCKTIEKICNDICKEGKTRFIFANGGDRKKDNIPEDKVCEKFDIEMIYNVGGNKNQSSSWLIGNVKKCVRHGEELKYCKECLKEEQGE